MKFRLKHLTLALAVLLLVSFSINLIQARGETRSSVRGTFVCSQGSYLVFMPGGFSPATGLFMKYQATDALVLSEGYYFSLGEGLYRLEDKTNTFIMDVFHIDERVYMFEESGKIGWFSLIDFTPLFLGVSFHEDLLKN